MSSSSKPRTSVPKPTKSKHTEVIHLDETPTEAQKVWAADNLAVPIVTTFWDEGKVREYRVDRDLYADYFRDAGYIIVIPGERFEIRLYRWATLQDLAWFEERIQAAQAGAIANWSPRSKGKPGLLYSWDRAIDPSKSRGRILVECDEPRCVNYGSEMPYHQVGSDIRDRSDWWYDHAAQLEFTTDGYDIRLFRVFNESDWTVRVDANDCSLTAAQAAGMASDLQWAGAEAKKLNSPHVEAVA